MNPVDLSSSTTVTPGTDEISAVEVQSDFSDVVSSSSAVLIKELAAAQARGAESLISLEGKATIENVVEALTTLVQALVGAVTKLLSGITRTTGVAPESSIQAATQSLVDSDTASSTSISATALPDLPVSSSLAQYAAKQPISTKNVTATPLKTSAAKSGSMFNVTRNDIGEIAVRTSDGFLLRAEGKDEAWSITGPDGKTTRVWGDPHVAESDGNRWDFHNRATFQFGGNKATIEVAPHKGQTSVTSRITLYSGSERVTIDGIDKNTPIVKAVSADGRQHDDGLADGVTYKRAVGARGESWKSNLTGKVM